MVPKSCLRSQIVAFIVLLLVGIIAFRHELLSWAGWTVIYSWTGFSTKTLWDWMQLLFIPGVLLGAGFWFNQIQKRREEKITQGQKEIEQAVANDNQRESLLQSYLDKMSELLVEKQLHKSVPEDETRGIARVRTLTVLSRLDGPRKRSVLQFLHEASLIDKDKHIIDLHGADLRGAALRGVNLFAADLSGANLSGADLREAALRGADLSGADLSEALLLYADLTKAGLREANLRGANLFGANLSYAKLSGADLRGAKLGEAKLGEADLSSATLDGATLSEDNLSHADLSGANLVRIRSERS